MQTQATRSPINPADIELGLDTFGDVTRDADGRLLSDAETIRNVVDEAVLAELTSDQPRPPICSSCL